MQEYLAQLASQGRYDKTKRPPCGNASFAGPTVIEVQLYLTQVNEVDLKLEQITVNGYMRSWWHDPRLAFNSTAQGGCLDTISIPGSESEGLWEPDLYVDNLVKCKKEGGLVEIYPDGSVWKSEQLTLEVKSPINLGKLPYDKHTAMIVVASYSQNIKRMRVLPRGGVIGQGHSGVGIIAPPLPSSVWWFGPKAEDKVEEGFETPGKVDVSLAWDYVTLEFDYARQPKYFMDQVFIPSLLFLMVSYIQFWVDPTAAPARATLAVLPVLIQRTLGNQVYKSLPEGSQRMWLGDFVSATMILSVLAACQFCVVQSWLSRERSREAKLAGLQKAGQAAQKLYDACKYDGGTLLDALSKCNAQEVLDDQDSAAKAEVQPAVSEPTVTVQPSDGMASTASHRIKSELSVRYGISEVDLLFITYAQVIFKRFDQDKSGYCQPAEVRKGLTYFNIFLSTAATASAMCMFLRDEGAKTPEDEMRLTLTFDQFTRLLTKVRDYTAHAQARKPAGIVAKMQGLAPSKRCDLLARRLFPVVLALMVAGFYLSLPLY